MDKKLTRIIELKEKFMEEKEGVLNNLAIQFSEINTIIEKIEFEYGENQEMLQKFVLDGSDFEVITSYIKCLSARKQKKIHERENVNKQIDAVRAELVELAIEVNIYKKLREKKIKEIKIIENRKLQKKLDDIAIRNARLKTS